MATPPPSLSGKFIASVLQDEALERAPPEPEDSAPQATPPSRVTALITLVREKRKCLIFYLVILFVLAELGRVAHELMMQNAP